MSISYNGLWKLLIDNNMNKTDLMNEVKLSSGTIAKMADIHKDANVNEDTKLISDKADKFYTQQKEAIAAEKSLRILDGVSVQLWARRDEAVMAIDTATKMIMWEHLKMEEPVMAKETKKRSHFIMMLSRLEIAMCLG